MAGLWSEIRDDQNLKFAPIFRNQLQHGRDMKSLSAANPKSYDTEIIG